MPHIQEVMTVHKNNHLLTKIAAFALLLALALASNLSDPAAVYASQSGTNNSTGYSFVLDDSADFIDDDMEEALLTKMKETTAYCNVAISTTTYHTYSSTERYAVETYESYFGQDANGVIFVIDRDLNEIYLAAEGKTQRIISDSKCDTICDNTYVYATSSHDYDYYTCCLETIDQVNTVLSGGRIAQPMKYISGIFIALAIGMILCFLYALKVSRGKKPNDRDIMNAAYTKVDVQNPFVQFTHETKTYSPQSSGSSGGSHGGGGGHSGGGGGHSGGGHHI